MSLVEYASSDDEFEENDVAGVKQLSTEVVKTETDSKSIKSLFATLPEPKYSTSDKRDISEGDGIKDIAKPSNELLTFEKKQKQPVKIFIPNINEFDDDDIPKKKQKLSQVSSGLVDMLPAPKNATLGKAADKLVPYVLTKKPAKTSPVINQNRTSITKVSKSTPTSKTLAATLVDYDDKDSDEDDNNESNDFFSLKTCESVTPDSINDKVLNIVSASSDVSHSSVTNSSTTSKLQMLSAGLVGYANLGGNDEKVDSSHSSLLEPCKSISIDNSCHVADVSSEIKNETGNAGIQSISSDSEYNDAPLNFRSDWASVVNASNSKPHQNCKEYNVVHPSEQRKSFVIKSEPQETTSAIEVAKEIDITDERFLRLQGKKQRGKEDIQIIDICADQQLPSVANILMKNLTEEVAYKPSRKKGEMPTTQQRRKHQITYLAFQAKERELELKNQWSNNRLTRRQTQAKYGF